ncbi:polysaccharide deacetylase family protein [Kitasatospora sp. NBC_01246]|uniref:polysaccharide deacetylase family protein n=1 Tax=Kitasatospora sp. NBC_01246 TaxID=2903570 RepID=UPI002E353114|nr:polysaccharide deacetylase family protein [Kitasatospora sp. NBC_01246]
MDAERGSVRSVLSGVRRSGAPAAAGPRTEVPRAAGRRPEAQLPRSRRPATRAPAQEATSPWILMYHSVAVEEDDPYQLTVSPERFAEQIAWLHRRGRRGVSVRELMRARAAGRADNMVGLTFDDGYADFGRFAVPILQAYGFTATAYVVADLLGRANDWDVKGPRKKLLTVQEVTELAAAGWEIGSHGLGHQALPGLPADVLATQTRESRRVLEEVVGGPVTGFCYPYGAVDLPATLAVRDAGYDYACAIAHSPLTGRYALPRCYVGDRDGAWRLRAKRGRHRLRDTVTELRRNRLAARSASKGRAGAEREETQGSAGARSTAGGSERPAGERAGRRGADR